jgi:drug/metabolite transporter superfamily protein YnfA
MAELLKRYFKICLLTSGPEDLPDSALLLKIMLLLYFISGCLSMWPGIGLGDSTQLMLLDCIILLLFSWLCLLALNKRSRFIQTATALTAVGTIFQLLAWPLLFYVDEVRQANTVPVEASLLLLVIISWNLAVYAHIFRQAFSVHMWAAFALTLAYVIINITSRGLLFADVGG